MPHESSLTVVIPHFNHGHLIHEQLEAILSQSLQPAKVIIVDDASTDNSVSAIRQLIAKRPGVELVCMEVNSGPVGVNSEGLDRVATEYVTFLAADDLILPGLLEHSVSVLDAYPNAAVCSALTRVEGRGGQWVLPHEQARPSSKPAYLSPEQVRSRLTRIGSWYLGCTAIYRTAQLRASGGFSAALHSFADEFMFNVLALQHGACFLPEVLAVNRQQVGGYAVRSTSRFERSRQILEESSRLMATKYTSLFPQELAARSNARMLFALASRQLDGFHAQMEELAAAARPVVGDSLFLFCSRSVTRLLRLAFFCALRPRDLPRVVVGRLVRMFKRGSTLR